VGEATRDAACVGLAPPGPGGMVIFDAAQEVHAGVAFASDETLQAGVLGWSHARTEWLRLAAGPLDDIAPEVKDAGHVETEIPEPPVWAGGHRRTGCGLDRPRDRCSIVDGGSQELVAFHTRNLTGCTHL
jgi:hypothetical protein